VPIFPAKNKNGFNIEMMEQRKMECWNNGRMGIAMYSLRLRTFAFKPFSGEKEDWNIGIIFKINPTLCINS